MDDAVNHLHGPFEDNLDEGEETACLERLIKFRVHQPPAVFVFGIVLDELLLAAWSHIHVIGISHGAFRDGRAGKEQLGILIPVDCLDRRAHHR